MTTAIEVSRLRYAYDAQDGGETHIVFDGLDLSVRQGSFVAILGLLFLCAFLILLLAGGAVVAMF